MANDAAPRFHKYLEDNGIPIEGVSIGDPDDKSTWAITFKQEATQQQKDDANGSLKNNFDNAPKAEKTSSDLFYEIDSLTSEQREKLFCMVLADYLKGNPNAIENYSGFSGWTGLDVRGEKPA